MTYYSNIFAFSDDPETGEGVDLLLFAQGLAGQFFRLFGVL